PSVRPAIAPVVSLIFMLTLADPGPPLVLGLRRTLGFQVVFASIGPDPFPRIAGLCLISLTITLAFQGLVLVWGRAKRYPNAIKPGTPDRPRPPGLDAAWPRTLAFAIVLVVGAVLAWLPCLGLARLSLAREPYPDNPRLFARLGVLDLLRRLTEPPTTALVLHSALLGLGVGLVAWMLASWLPRGAVDPTEQRWRRVGWALVRAVPPLVMGIGVLALSRLVQLGSLWLETRLRWPGAARGLALLGRILDPYGGTGLALFLGVCLAHLPLKLLARFRPLEHAEPSSRRIDQALLAGAGRHRARSLGLRGSGNVSSRTILLWAVLAATGIAPAIVLAPTLESRPMGPGIVALADGPDDARSRAAALALLVIAANLAVFGWSRAKQTAGAGGSRSSGPAVEDLT
ncbi:MAG: hypothetical protein ACP5XB_31720, partial [Isosphaeraceae bacterium]